MTKLLPRELTSYDLLKTLAVVLMVIDHLGYYLFPDEQWMRVLGRLCVPMWFFLIGYARTRDLPTKLWIGAAVLIVGSILYGHYIFPVNILVTMILLRLTMDKALAWFMHSRVCMVAVGFVLTVLIIPSSVIFEYGVMVYILGFLGYFVRHKEEKQYSPSFIMNYILFACLTFLMMQTAIHAFSVELFYGLAGGSVLVFLGLMNFKGKIVDIKLPFWAVATLQFTGRRTLEIYVIHILVFGFTAMFMGDPRFGFMDWEWVFELW